MTVLHGIESGSDKNDARAATLRISALEYSSGTEDRGLPDRRSDHSGKPEVRRGTNREGTHASHGQEARRGRQGSAGGGEARRRLRRRAVHARLDRDRSKRSRAPPRTPSKACSSSIRAPRRRAFNSRVCSSRAARRPSALESAEEVSRERPDDVDAAVLMSRSLRAQGDLPRAERELTPADFAQSRCRASPPRTRMAGAAEQ